jgi:hypothetical protein
MRAPIRGRTPAVWRLARRLARSDVWSIKRRIVRQRAHPCAIVRSCAGVRPLSPGMGMHPCEPENSAECSLTDHDAETHAAGCKKEWSDAGHSEVVIGRSDHDRETKTGINALGRFPGTVPARGAARFEIDRLGARRVARRPSEGTSPR